MASNQSSRADRSRRRMALAMVVGALLLAAGGWLSSRPSDAAGPSKATAASSPTNEPGSSLPAAKSEAASAVMAVASSAPGSTSAPPLAPDWPAAALRRVQLALDGHGTPKDMLEAAMMLSACQGADAMVDHQYKERDQPSATGRQLQPSSARLTRWPRG
jgi:hypothetical protein